MKTILINLLADLPKAAAASKVLCVRLVARFRFPLKTCFIHTFPLRFHLKLGNPGQHLNWVKPGCLAHPELLVPPEVQNRRMDKKCSLVYDPTQLWRSGVLGGLPASQGPTGPPSDQSHMTSPAQVSATWFVLIVQATGLEML